MVVIDIEAIRKLSYEEVFAEAEKCMDALEGSNVGLEEALEIAERGRAYLQICSEKLDAAKQRIEVRAAESVSDIV
jgi:exodeoxyribonuclease VII small subunit